jgi:hypothetical protein
MVTMYFYNKISTPATTNTTDDDDDDDDDNNNIKKSILYLFMCCLNILSTNYNFNTNITNNIMQHTKKKKGTQKQ